MQEHTRQVMKRFWAERISRIRELIKVERLDGLLVTDRRIQYWLGYENVSVLLVTELEVVVSSIMCQSLCMMCQSLCMGAYRS